MTKQKHEDLVLVPHEWLPLNALELLSVDIKGRASPGQAQFYTNDLGTDGEVYYINNDGYLIHESFNMNVVVSDTNINLGRPSLVVDTTHKPVLNPILKKLYSQVTNKMCILLLRFKEHKVIEVQSIIRPCTQ
jgi:hypothetical protein